MDFDLGRSPQGTPAQGLPGNGQLGGGSLGGGVLSGGIAGFSQRVKAMLTGAPGADGPVDPLIRAHRAVHPDADPSVIRRGYAVAERMHRGQMRKSGDPYITHPLAVAEILADLGMDTTTIVAALLHDTVEDTSYTMRQLREGFGDEVARVVDGVTKFDKAYYGQVAEAETYRKMIVTAGEDVRVLIVKLADRLHNMRTIDARSASSRARIARATQDVLVPLCERLGIQALKRELEDCVLESLEPDAYATIRTHVNNRPEWTAFLDSFLGDARAALRADKIAARVEPRPRHAFSIWKDTVAGEHTIPFELPRIVVIVNGSETECYTALGAIHGRWRPVPGRFKDFVASPKNNLYRSLHTTVIGPTSQPVEVLIRTEAMHRNAEFGIIAAFRFKDAAAAEATASVRATAKVSAASAKRARGAGGGRPAPEPRRGTVERVRSRLSANRAEHLAWLHRVVEWQREAIDPVRFLESLRCDLAEDQLHVFAGGTRLLLPEGATPVDVAYAMGDQVGERCIAATVNGRLAAISSPLEDGDVVDVHTAGPEERTGPDGEAIGPSREWLRFVRTPRAQLQITRWLAQHEEVDPAKAPPLPIAAKVRIGATAIRIALRHRERGLANDAPLHQVATTMGYPDLDTLLVAVAEHKRGADVVADQLIDAVDTDERVAPPTGW